MKKCIFQAQLVSLCVVAVTTQAAFETFSDSDSDNPRLNYTMTRAKQTKGRKTPSEQISKCQSGVCGVEAKLTPRESEGR